MGDVLKIHSSGPGPKEKKPGVVSTVRTFAPYLLGNTTLNPKVRELRARLKNYRFLMKSEREWVRDVPEGMAWKHGQMKKADAKMFEKFEGLAGQIEKAETIYRKNRTTPALEQLVSLYEKRALLESALNLLYQLSDFKKKLKEQLPEKEAEKYEGLITKLNHVKAALYILQDDPKQLAQRLEEGDGFLYKLNLMWMKEQARITKKNLAILTAGAAALKALESLPDSH